MPTDGRVPPALTVVPAAVELSAVSRTGAAGSVVPERASLFCLVEPAFGGALLRALREHFAHDPVVAVLIERRTERRARLPTDGPAGPRRRAPVAERDVGRVVPPSLRARARHVRLVQPMAALGHLHQDTGLLELVGRTVAMEPAATTELWWRVSPRVLARLALKMSAADEPATVRAMLGRVLDELPRYKPGGEPLPTWLDTVVDRFAEEHTAAPPPSQPFNATASVPQAPLRVAA